MEEPIPITNDIQTIYSPDVIESQKARWSQLTQQFNNQYGKNPQFIARSPGRVNIIGEHIDYSLYDVLPMAITADILVAVSTSPKDSDSQEETNISIANIDPKTYTSTDFSIPHSGEIPIDPSNHSWTNYFKAGLNGALKHLRTQSSRFPSSKLSVLIDGDVSAGSGLSSSAALVCASALAVLHAANPSPISKRSLVDLAITSERAVGVNSGGMDQAASVLSIRNDALSVSFFPHLDAHPIAFPTLDPPITFMIAQTFVAADKAVSAPECYNLRVVECTLAAHMMAAALNLTLEPDASPLESSLRGFQTAYFATTTPTPTPQTQLETMLSLLPTLLPSPSGYAPSSIPRPLLNSVTSRFPIRATRFHPRRRAHHVFTEALRVLAFTAALQAHPPLPAAELLPRLGALMDASQASCRDSYECSCAELDTLCAIAKRAGAHGARLTGAGWGGCVVCLVPGEDVDAVREAWVKEYYAPRGVGERELEKAVVVSAPGMGSVM